MPAIETTVDLSPDDAEPAARGFGVLTEVDVVASRLSAAIDAVHS